MKELFSEYINAISGKFSREQTSEMGYRKEFETLLEGVFDSLGVKEIDHDAKAKKGNKPDFAVLKNSIPIVYLEVKDIGVSLDKIEKSEQMTRYFGYSNLVLSDYVEFRFYRNGIKYEDSIKIGEVNLKNRSITALPDNFEHLRKTLLDFATSHREPIKSGEHLAKIMGGKGQRIRDNIKQFLNQDHGSNEELEKVYESIQKLLVHDLEVETFADMYAQTLVYGLFVARYYDESAENFSRQEARDLIPASNPFLQGFFDHIAGPKFDKRLSFIVDELCEIFRHADVKLLMEQYFKEDLWGKKHVGPDPVIHFYEDFLKEYDQELRKKMGAYYTPMPVVDFIVKSVDQIIQKDFGLSKGLADTEKLPNGLHRVQILDPATGTGTFLGEVIKNIYSKFTDQKGRWASYVHHDLLPRLHGFELMMAPYTIAHLKISLELQKTGFKYFNETKSGKARLGIYLTNSLEEGFTNDGTLFSFGLAESIAEESKAATEIKNNKPIMVVLGNPPYSAVSSNKMADYLVEKYKVEPSGNIRLKERKNWLNDDYVKFISFAENLVSKNSEGVLAYITNNGFIDNPTFRGMRWHLLKTFDDIYIIDLHGNAKKKEKSPDGGRDENVFNIMQGVSINIFVKKNKDKKDFGSVYHVDLYGKREDKFDFLDKNNLRSINWEKIETTLPNLFFAAKGNIKDREEYEHGFLIASHTGDSDGLFLKNSCGVVTMGDSFIVDENKDILMKRVSDFLNNNISEIDLKTKYELGKNYAKWVVENKKNIKTDDNKVIKYSYRPFDDRFTIFDKNLIWRIREDVMKDVPVNDFSMVFEKLSSNYQPVGIYLSKNIIDCHLTGGQSYIGNLYSLDNNNEKKLNLNPKILDKIEKIVGKTLPEDIFDYVYASLHSPTYRNKYKEFLRIDFPRVPYPRDRKQFESLVKLGKEMRELHLMESRKIDDTNVSYPEAGEDIVEKAVWKDEKVYINKNQYFGGVPEVAWNFYIGGYQPAQKWLKDRKGRILTNQDIEHYQKIIMVLLETSKIMGEVDKILSF